MKNVTVFDVESPESVYKRLDEIKQVFLKDGVFALRGLKLDADEYQRIYPDKVVDKNLLPKAPEQFELTKTLGDFFGWYPNSKSTSWDHIMVENHSRNDISKYSKDDNIIDWHLEHVDYDSHIPLLASVWSMWNLSLAPSSGSGNTLFVDSALLYSELSDSDAEFLSKCLVTWYDTDNSGPHSSEAVVEHWLTGSPTIRLEITSSVRLFLKSFDGKTPAQEEKNRFDQIKKNIVQRIGTNKLSLVHEWYLGDVVVPDLQRMAHTVTGGFKPHERTFTNFFTYLRDPYLLSEAEKPLIWRQEWVDKMYKDI